jgi:hypothetical protein
MEGQPDIKIDLKENGVEDVDWINLAQDNVRYRASVTTIMNRWTVEQPWRKMEVAK